MEQDIERTTVIFRRANGGGILAVFPYLLTGDIYLESTCYAHIGQHSACDWYYITSKTRPASPAEYADLKHELESLGYLLDVKQYRSARQFAKAYYTWRHLRS